MEFERAIYRTQRTESTIDPPPVISSDSTVQNRSLTEHQFRNNLRRLIYMYGVSFFEGIPAAR